MFDIQIAEQEWDDCLAAWIDDFWSDEWAATACPAKRLKLNLTKTKEVNIVNARPATLEDRVLNWANWLDYDIGRDDPAGNDLREAAAVLDAYLDLAVVAERICKKLEDPFSPVTIVDQSELRSALARVQKLLEASDAGTLLPAEGATP